MKKLSIFFIPLTMIMLSCGMKGNFNKQKYTNLKHIKAPSDLVESDEQIPHNFDGTHTEVSYSEQVENTSIPSDIEFNEQVIQEEGSDYTSYSEVKSSKKESVPHVLKEHKRRDKNKDKEEWEISKKRGWLFLGLSAILVGLGLGLSVLFFTELFAWILWPLAGVALAFSGIYFAKSIRQKHGEEVKHKHLKIWSIISFFASFGLAFLGIWIAFITSFEIWLFTFLLLAVGAFVMSILMYLWSYKGIPG